MQVTNTGRMDQVSALLSLSQQEAPTLEMDRGYKERCVVLEGSPASQLLQDK